MKNESLTFETFRVWQVVVPARQDIISAPPAGGALPSGSGQWPDQPIHLVEGTTSAGTVAVGECGRGTSREVVEATLRDLLGRNLLAVTPATVWMEAPQGLPPLYPPLSWEIDHGKSLVLMESLWLDAVGKAAHVPAHQLLGGAVREGVPTGFWAYRPPAETLLALVREAVDRGFSDLKMKSDGRGDTARTLVEIAADLPADFRFNIDPMCAWRSLRESDRIFEALSKLPCPVQIEDPFPYQMIDDWRRARQLFPLSIICHARNEAVLRTALREEMADAFNLSGGSVYSFLRMAHAAEFAGKDCWLGSSLELGVLQHVRLHAAACARNCVLASDLQSEWVREQTLITPHMRYEDGCALVPERPGLGIELDHDAIAHYTQETFTVA